MGVRARAVIYAPDEPAALAGATAAFDRIAALEQVMSDYRPASELSRLNARAGHGPVPVSDDLFRVLDRALDLAARTEGAFDPTLGPLIRPWRDSRESGTLPDAGRVSEARGRVGWPCVALDPIARTVELARPGMELSLGGIGKGYAAGEAVAVLRARGLPRSLVALAGDVAVGAPPPGERGWRIAVLSGRAADAPVGAVLVSDAAVSTSGDAEQFVEIAGVRYAHILDPATGLGLTRAITATAVAADGATADGLATALAVLGADAGPKVLGRFPGAHAAVAEGAGRPVFRASPRFPWAPHEKAKARGVAAPGLGVSQSGPTAR